MIGLAEDYERSAREVLPVSIDSVVVLPNHPEVGYVTLLVRWQRPYVRSERQQDRAAELVRACVQEDAPVNVIVNVESVR